MMLTMSIDLNDPALVAGAVSILEGKLNLLEGKLNLLEGSYKD